jgi:hypothetical protein
VEHKAEFSQEERDTILAMFPDRHIRLEMRSLPEHCHCHLEWPRERKKRNGEGAKVQPLEG